LTSWRTSASYPGPTTRPTRAKLIVPTERSRPRMRAGDQIIAEIERRHEAKLGRLAYAGFKQAFRVITTDQPNEHGPEEQSG
jgi:hypothetical protein